jgi:DNA-binding MarR family transcriptional regulator
MSEAERPSVGSSARLATRIAKHIEFALAAIELSPSQYLALARLSEGPAGASRLALSVAISRPTVTTLVDSLVARGFVDRTDDPRDRRRIALSLTDAGRAALAEADAAVEERFWQVLDYGTPAQAENAIAGLQLWHAPLDAYRDEHEGRERR